MKNKQLLSEFQSVVESKILINDIDQYLSDWRGVYKGNTNFVVFPKTTNEVSKIIKLANSYDLPIVPFFLIIGLCG